MKQKISEEEEEESETIKLNSENKRVDQLNH